MREINKWLLAICVCGLPLLPARADEMAVTDQWPAALAALDAAAVTIVDVSEAHQVRAEFFPSSGVLFSLTGISNYRPNAATSFNLIGGGQDIVVGVSEGVLFFASDGVGVLGTHSRIGGVMATRSSNFTGVLTFEGSPTSADVVAYPDLFSVRIR